MSRRRMIVVLWGGRPDLDVQIGSPRDRRRQERLRKEWEARLALLAMTEPLKVAFREFGRRARAQSAAIRRLLDELNRQP